ncbi:MAG: hypothetical protein ACLGIV_00700 [Actinomycetes bacterium]
MSKVLGVLVLLLLAVAAWVGVRGYLAYGHARDAADGLAAVQSAVADGDVETARGELAGVQDDTGATVRLTSDPVWRSLAAFPFGGQNLAAVSTAAAAADDVTTGGLPALIDAAEGLREFGSSLRSGDLDPEALQSTVDGVERLDASLTRAQADIEAIDRRYLLPQVEQALDELASSVDVAAQAREAIAGQLPAR